jgi:hypothetical protein
MDWQCWNKVSKVSNEKQSLAKSTRVMLVLKRFSIKYVVSSMLTSLDAHHFGLAMSVRLNLSQSESV